VEMEWRIVPHIEFVALLAAMPIFVVTQELRSSSGAAKSQSPHGHRTMRAADQKRAADCPIAARGHKERSHSQNP
jgi:hypothetical protein